METCGLCKITNENVCDGLCDSCEGKWLNELSKVTSSIRVTPESLNEISLKDLFNRVNESLLEQNKILSKFQQDGPVPVYKYEFDQDVKYILLGEFVIEGAYRTVICTLESGKGNMRRIGLHWIVIHNEQFITTDTLSVIDAKEFISQKTEIYSEEMKNTPIWMEIKLAQEVYRVAKTYVDK